MNYYVYNPNTGEYKEIKYKIIAKLIATALRIKTGVRIYVFKDDSDFIWRTF